MGQQHVGGLDHGGFSAAESSAQHLPDGLANGFSMCHSKVVCSSGLGQKKGQTVAFGESIKPKGIDGCQSGVDPGKGWHGKAWLALVHG